MYFNKLEKTQGLRAYCSHMYIVSAAIFFTMALESIFVPISVLLIALAQYLVPAEHIQIKPSMICPEVIVEKSPIVPYVPRGLILNNTI